MESRAPDLPERTRELLKSARAQLSAIIDSPTDRPTSEGPLYKDILRIMGEIEKLLGY